MYPTLQLRNLCRAMLTISNKHHVASNQMVTVINNKTEYSI